MQKAPETLAPPLILRGRAGGSQTLVCGGSQLEVTPLFQLAYKLNFSFVFPWPHSSHWSTVIQQGLSALQSFDVVAGCCLFVCLLSVARVYCDKTTAKQVNVSTVSMASLKTKFERSLLDQGLICWGGLELCQNVVITGYIFIYDVTLLPGSHSQWTL